MPGNFSIWPPALLSLLGFLSVAIVILLLVKKTAPSIPSWLIGILTFFQSFFGAVNFLYPHLKEELALLPVIEFLLIFSITCFLLLQKVRSGKNNTVLLMGITAFISSGATMLLMARQPEQMEWLMQVLSGLVIIMCCLYLFIRQTPDPSASIVRWPFLWIALGSLSFWGMKATIAFTLLCFPGYISGTDEKNMLLLFFLIIQTVFFLLALLLAKNKSAENN